MQMFVIIASAIYQFIILEAQTDSKYNFELLDSGCPELCQKESEMVTVYSWIVLESSIFYFNLIQLGLFIVLTICKPENILQ